MLFYKLDMETTRIVYSIFLRNVSRALYCYRKIFVNFFVDKEHYYRDHHPWFRQLTIEMNSNQTIQKQKKPTLIMAGLVVELRGFEPRTSCMPCKRSSQLSYSPIEIT